MNSEKNKHHSFEQKNELTKKSNTQISQEATENSINEAAENSKNATSEDPKNEIADSQNDASEDPKNEIEQETLHGIGIALDIGTTTLAMKLVDMASGDCLGLISRANPQRKYGSDVINRIVFCEKQIGNLKKIRTILMQTINEMIEEVCIESEISSEDISAVVACGNTVMSHIFAGYDPSSLARSPFTPRYTGVKIIDPLKAGINISENARIVLLPNIGGHVGGDTTAGIIATDLSASSKPTLLVDIGTNGEIVISDGKKIEACSAAAGPAFEGAAIKCGMRAAEGAIRAASLDNNDRISLETVANDIPKGICGSGLIDLVAVMLERGLVDYYGKMLLRSPRMRESNNSNNSKNSREYLIVSADELKYLAKPANNNNKEIAGEKSIADKKEIAGEKSIADIKEIVGEKNFLYKKDISDIKETATKKSSDLKDFSGVDDSTKMSDIVLTQDDIRQVQLAKGAIKAGIATLLADMNYKEDDIKKVILTGAFGSTVKPESAIAIGLLPKVSPDIFDTIEDAALEGARKVLLDPKLQTEVEALTEKIKHVELAKSEIFQELYIKSMNFDD